jgi:hypothetical protein
VLPPIFRQEGFYSMSECDDSVDKSALPSEQAQPPQPTQSGNDRELAARGGLLAGDIVDSTIMGSAITDSKRTDRQRAVARKRTPVLDYARFSAGIVSLYEAVLSEPIPEKMLRLVEEIGKQERKS